MTISVRLALLLGERKLRAAELARRTGINKNTISALWNERSSGIAFDTLDKLCRELDCQVGDILKYVTTEEAAAWEETAGAKSIESQSAQ